MSDIYTTFFDSLGAHTVHRATSTQVTNSCSECLHSAHISPY